MYNDTIKVDNKIISDDDLADIFQKMNEEIVKNQQLYEKEKMQNEKYELEYQRWTVKDFSGKFNCEIDFYDDTNINLDNYASFINVFNNRIREIKRMWIRYSYSYVIQNGRERDYIYPHINMSIYENKMDIDVKISSKDKKMDDIYNLIKDKILNAPERYDRIIKKKSSITAKISFALGVIPSIIICFLPIFNSTIRIIYSESYVIFPLIVIVLGYMLGTMLFSGKLNSLYSTITPKKKYAGYDHETYKSIYKDDIDSYVNSSEIIIGKNIDNLKNRKEIELLERKYSKYIPIELLVILGLSVIVVIIGKLI